MRFGREFIYVLADLGPIARDEGRGECTGTHPIPGWPQIKLSSPFKHAPYMMPLDALPQGFQQAV